MAKEKTASQFTVKIAESLNRFDDSFFKPLTMIEDEELLMNSNLEELLSAVVKNQVK